MIEGKSVLYKITLPEGRTTAQLLKIIEEDSVLEGALPTEEVAEGTLLPDTYLFQRATSRADLIARMQGFKDERMRTGIDHLGAIGPSVGAASRNDQRLVVGYRAANGLYSGFPLPLIFVDARPL